MGIVLLKLLYAAVLGIVFIGAVVLATVHEKKQEDKENERRTQSNKE